MITSDKKDTKIVKTKKLRKEKFAFNRDLRKVLFSRNTELIGEGAFYDCRNLQEVLLTDSLKALENDAFSQCENLKSIQLPENTEKIGKGCFSWSGIKSIVLPAKLKAIEDLTFSNCMKLQKISINENCTSIGENAFSNCVGLTEINIPQSVTAMGTECFKGCSALKTIKLSDNIKILPRNAFENCRALETIVLPSDLKIIEDECFAGCVNLKSIIFPETLEHLGKKAFYRCERLEKIQLPKKLSYLGDYAFKSCKSITYAEINGDLDYAGAAIFTDYAITPENNIQKMFVTSFLKKSDYKFCPTITIPESTQFLRLGYKGIIPHSYVKRNKTCYNHILAFKKYNTKVFISENYYSDNYNILNNSAFDFEFYDSLFENAEDYEKPVIAAFRLSYPTQLNEKARYLYQEEINKNAKNAVIFAVNDNEEKVFKYLIDNAYFDTSFCEELHLLITEHAYTNLLQILSSKQVNTGFDEINSLLEELTL